MDNKDYIDYLNTLHNYNAQNENAYGERNVDNPYFNQVMVNMGIGKYISEKLEHDEPHIIILTGHAGDGKTSIMYQVLTDIGATFDAKEKQNEIELPQGAKCLCIKDFSELPENSVGDSEDRLQVMKKAINMVRNGNYVFMVANTGPVINTFGELFDTAEDREKYKIELINLMDDNDGQVKRINDIPLRVINMAKVDNVFFATEFLEKITQGDLWKKCDSCNKKSYCPICRNRDLIVENKSQVYRFIKNHFVWLTEYGTRLTIRSMTEQLAYMITGGMSCDEVTGNEAYKYLFSNLFFGYIGTRLNPKALNITAIEEANKCMYDHKRLRVDEKLIIGKEYKELFGGTIEKIIIDAEKNYAFAKGWNEFLRRTYLFTNIVTDSESVSHDYEDIFSKQFERFLSFRDGENSNPSKGEVDLIAGALSMIYEGVPCDGKAIPITLSRESGLTQNVQLITGMIMVRDLKVKCRNAESINFNGGSNRYELVLEIKKQRLDTKLSLPMLDYFEELKNGVIATNIDPQLSHGVEALKSQISDLLSEDEDEDLVEIVVLKNSGNQNICFELENDKIIVE